MTFTHEYADLSEIIKNFSCEGDNYIIEYLDGAISSYTCYDEKEKQRIKNIMIEQAKNRDEIMQVMGLESCLKKYVYLFCTVVISLSTFFTEEQISKVIEILLAVAFAKKSSCLSKQLKELKKYRMFLKLIDEVSNINEQEVLECEAFDIDTLDKYSYKQVKKFYEKYRKMD